MNQPLNKSPEFVKARENRLRRLMSTEWAARNTVNAHKFWNDPERKIVNVVRFRKREVAA
jgi:hypothetical protein